MKDFLRYIYDISIILKEKFLITEEKSWSELTVLNELNVQIGHIYNIQTDSLYNEEYRHIINIGDEVSDVFFQLVLLLYYGNYNVEEIKYNSYSRSLDDFIICLGQLNEIALEKYGYRFKKNREGFKSSREYIIFKISNLFSILYNYALSKNINLYLEYDLMVQDANAFLNKYKK